MAAYFREIKGSRSLTLKEEVALGNEIRKGNKKAVNILVQANLKFVVAVCRNYLNRGLPLGDLINEGNLGLIRAAHRFDGAANFKFISYAVWWIRQGILTALAEQSRSLNVSTSRVEAIRKIGLATRVLEQRNHRAPNEAELMEATGHSATVIRECRMIAAPPLSFNRPPAEGGSSNFEDLLEDKAAERPDQAVADHLIGKRLDGMLDGLGEREQLVLRLHFGIGCGTAYSLRDIGARLALSRERIRQIKDKALKRLKKPLPAFSSSF